MQRGCLFVVKDDNGGIIEVGIALDDTTFPRHRFGWYAAPSRVADG